MYRAEEKLKEFFPEYAALKLQRLLICVKLKEKSIKSFVILVYQERKLPSLLLPNIGILTE